MIGMVFGLMQFIGMGMSQTEQFFSFFAKKQGKNKKFAKIRKSQLCILSNFEYENKSIIHLTSNTESNTNKGDDLSTSYFNLDSKIDEKSISY